MCRDRAEIVFQFDAHLQNPPGTNTLLPQLMDFLSSAQTSLKICGVRNEADAHRLVELGVDAVGFNFWPNSKRYLSPESADWLHGLHGDVLRIGVFVNQSLDLPMRLVTEDMIDVVQLHGDETMEMVSVFKNAGIKVIKAIGVKTAVDVERAGEFDVDAILLDAHAPVVFGGTGETFDWSLALDFKMRFPNTPIILAGGIHPHNAAQAIADVRPAALDVASGAEISPGVKDFFKVQQLVEACRRVP